MLPKVTSLGLEEAKRAMDQMDDVHPFRNLVLAFLSTGNSTSLFDTIMSLLQ